MTSSRLRSRIVPVVLGLAMLAVVVAAGLSPNTGVVQAQTNQPYPPTPSSSSISPYVYLGIAALVIVAGLLLALFLLRRRRPPAAGAPPPMQTWQGGAPPPTGGGPPAAAPAYLETPEDIGHAPPPGPAAKAAEVAAPAAAAPAAAGEAEPDIDSLMAELDNISGEILKRAPKKTTGAKTEEDTGEGKGQ
jgi:hypothetical protein